jgi:hypothetical protein
MIIVAVAGFIIIDTGFNSNGSNGTVETRYNLRLELYSSVHNNLSGEIIIKVGENLYENITIDNLDYVFSTKDYKGSYSLYYQGAENLVSYGPVSFVVETSGLVMDQVFFDVRIIIHAIAV